MMMPTRADCYMRLDSTIKQFCYSRGARTAILAFWKHGIRTTVSRHEVHYTGSQTSRHIALAPAQIFIVFLQMISQSTFMHCRNRIPALRSCYARLRSLVIIVGTGNSRIIAKCTRHRQCPRWCSSNEKVAGFRGQKQAASAQPFARHAVRMGGIHSRGSDMTPLVNTPRSISCRERRAARNVRQLSTLDEPPSEYIICRHCRQ